MDWLHGTDKAFRSSERYKQHNYLIPFISNSLQIYEQQKEIKAD
jgi:hypothetical protein